MSKVKVRKVFIDLTCLFKNLTLSATFEDDCMFQRNIEMIHCFHQDLGDIDDVFKSSEKVPAKMKPTAEKETTKDEGRRVTFDQNQPEEDDGYYFLYCSYYPAVPINPVDFCHTTFGYWNSLL